MYRVELRPKARKELSRLPREHQERVGSVIDTLRSNPFAGKKLEGKFQGAWAIRAWPYRIIYTIHQDIVTVRILKIGHRQGAYKP